MARPANDSNPPEDYVTLNYDPRIIPFRRDQGSASSGLQTATRYPHGGQLSHCFSFEPPEANNPEIWLTAAPDTHTGPARQPTTAAFLAASPSSPHSAYSYTAQDQASSDASGRFSLSPHEPPIQEAEAHGAPMAHTASQESVLSQWDRNIAQRQNPARVLQCKWEGCDSSVTFSGEATLMRHLKTVHVSPETAIQQSGVDVSELLAKFPHLAPVMVRQSEVRRALRAALRGRTLNNAPLPHQVIVGISDEMQPDDGEATNLSTSWQSDPKFSHRIRRRSDAVATTTPQQTRVDYAQAIRAANTTEAARLVVEDALRLNIANAIASEFENITVEKPVTAYGVDSLRATELRNWASQHFDSQVSIFDILRPEPIYRLASVILSKSPFGGSNARTTDTQVAGSRD
ncbi:acyl carrier protein [Aspergillus lucknowensis]|uniref:Carrier domain-containing protein n=1 Tax=Aspergillus lucknowensis TaxID=176173 RepID=A0ABR4LS55_9EURO